MLDATVAADAHPVVAQLSALHQFRIYVDVALVVVVLVLAEPRRALHHAVGECCDGTGSGGRAGGVVAVQTGWAGLELGAGP